MNQQLVNDNYLYIPNFISKWKADSLAKKFEEFAEKEGLGGDEQAPNSSSCYNFVDFTELLCDKIPHVSRLMGEKVFPTYVYGRVYRKGDDLKPHTDRDSCEVSLTVNLFERKPWPIYIKKPSGETSKVMLQPGDAMIYLGCIAEHWREELQEDKHVQVFLHYVRSRGPRSEFLFDSKNASVKKIHAPSIVEPSGVIPSLADHILYFPDFFDKQLADDLLQEYKDTDEWVPSAIGGGENAVVDTSIRGATVISISVDPTMDKNRDVRKRLDERMHEAAIQALNAYMLKFPKCATSMDTGYELLRYKEGAGYKQHVDDFTDFPRVLSCSFGMNDDFEGGEFTFFDGALSFKQKKGSILIFPSNFMFPHQVNAVTKGTRYSIITWFR
jgi:alkylated DNA repair dioxygenase AlkB